LLQLHSFSFQRTVSKFNASMGQSATVAPFGTAIINPVQANQHNLDLARRRYDERKADWQAARARLKNMKGTPTTFVSRSQFHLWRLE
jgi:hypothetical protein